MVVVAFFWLMIYPLLKLGEHWTITAIQIGSGLFLWGELLLLWIFSGIVAQAIHLGRLRRRITRGEAVHHGKDWQCGALFRDSGAESGLTAAWVCVMLTQCSAAVLEEDKIPLADYTGDPPFATIADFAAGDYALQPYAFPNTVHVWSDWLAPVNFAWDELAAVTRSDGTQLEGDLSVDYHEARFPQLAKRLARSTGASTAAKQSPHETTATRR